MKSSSSDFKVHMSRVLSIDSLSVVSDNFFKFKSRSLSEYHTILPYSLACCEVVCYILSTFIVREAQKLYLLCGDIV